MSAHSQEVGCGWGDGATAAVGVGGTFVGPGDGVASAGVDVERTRRCGLGRTISTVPQIMLSTTSKLRIQNSVRAPPCRERLNSYLPVLLPFAGFQSLQGRLGIWVNLQSLL
jgi:hypothetical protein